MKGDIWTGLLILLCLLGAAAPPATAGDAVPTLPADPDTPWLWVVPQLARAPGDEWVLSGFFGGLGGLELELALVDREGRFTALTSWKLVAGVPADYRLPGLEDPQDRDSYSLVVSGLEAGPSWLALSLWRSSSTRGLEEIDGAWIRSDPNWLPGVRTGP